AAIRPRTYSVGSHHGRAEYAAAASASSASIARKYHLRRPGGALGLRTGRMTAISSTLRGIVSSRRQMTRRRFYTPMPPPVNFNVARRSIRLAATPSACLGEGQVAVATCRGELRVVIALQSRPQ